MALPYVYGTERDDALIQAPPGQASDIEGLSGDDMLVGSALNDYIDGGYDNWRNTGFDDPDIVGDDDTIDAGAGDDVIQIGGGNDEIDGGSGLDTAIFGASFSFVIEISHGTYTSAAARMSNIVINLASGTYTGEYRDGGKLIASVTGAIISIEKITGSVDDDTIIGSGGDEFFRPIGGSDSIHGGGGFDILRYDNAEVGAPETHGISVDFTSMTVKDTEGDTDRFSDIDQIIGTVHADTFKGAAGAQVFTGGGGADAFDGGAGTDTVTYRYETGEKGIVIDLVNKVGYDTFGATDTFDRVENIKGSAHDDSIIGDAGPNELQGREGKDSILGGTGHDLIYGDIDAGGPAAFSDFLRGGDGKDTIYGGGGNDTIDGESGNDKLYGGAGNDTIDGKSGDDKLDGGAGQDTYDASSSTKNLEINLSTGVARSGKEKDVLSSFENAHGGGGNDLIVGDDHVNQLWGGSGDDTIAGGGGLDTMDGGAGIDAVDYAGSSVAVTAVLYRGYASFVGVSGKQTIDGFENIFGSDNNDGLYGDKERNRLFGDKGNDKVYGEGGKDDLFGGDGNDTIDGDEGSDFLSGGNGADRVIGSKGDDNLSGDAGRDTLIGGAGIDHFYFSALKDSVVGANRDTIDDFTQLEHDRIGLEGIDADTHTKDDQAFHYIGKANFSSSAKVHVYGELRYAKGIVSGDVDGDGKADFEIAVTDVPKLIETNFIL